MNTRFKTCYSPKERVAMITLKKNASSEEVKQRLHRLSEARLQRKMDELASKLFYPSQIVT